MVASPDTTSAEALFAEAGVVPTVLVVDDDPSVGTLLRYVLEDRYDVVFAPGGVEAVEMIDAGTSFDAAVVDVMMPDVDGFGVVEAIRAVRGSVPVMMLTALSGADTRERAAKAGASNYLTKPFDPDLLGSALELLLT